MLNHATVSTHQTPPQPVIESPPLDRVAALMAYAARVKETRTADAEHRAANPLVKPVATASETPPADNVIAFAAFRRIQDSELVPVEHQADDFPIDADLEAMHADAPEPCCDAEPDSSEIEEPIARVEHRGPALDDDERKADAPKPQPRKIDPVTRLKFYRSLNRDQRLTAADLRIAWHFIDRYHDDLGYSHPTMVELGDIAGVGENQVGKSIRKLTARGGWFHSHKARFNKNQYANLRYWPDLSRADLVGGAYTPPAGGVRDPHRTETTTPPVGGIRTPPVGGIRTPPVGGAIVLTTPDLPEKNLQRESAPARLSAGGEKGDAAQIEHDVVDQPVNHEPPVTIEAVSTEQPAKAKPSRRKPAPRPNTTGTLLPEDWEPSAENIEWAMEGTGYTRDDVDFRTSKFCAHFETVHGDKALNRNWAQRWRTWIAKDANDEDAKRVQEAARLAERNKPKRRMAI